MKKLFILFAVSSVFLFSCSHVADVSWPEVTRETKPGVRWWWLGSAVDSAGLTANMEDLYHAGIGSVEITPIYGINGYEQRHIDYLSPRWMNMYKHVHDEGNRLGMNIDMSTGTGWPFGGPTVSAADAASKVFFQKYQVKGGTRFEKKIESDDPRQAEVSTLAAVIAYSRDEKIDIIDHVNTDGILCWDVPPGEWTIWAVINGKTGQMVKRAAPGGEGWVINHFSKEVLTRYLSRFENAFASSQAPWPNSFFNDSYEVYGADWSENLFEEFEHRRGYRLQEFLPELNREGDPETSARVICDYRQTLADLLLNEFTTPWTEWAHSRGATTRNQAHGSPGNLIDYYAAVDIPECESFGRTFFDIPGLRVDSGMKENDSHPSVLKYASSAAHITGKKWVSSETFTWLTEHFRTSLSQMKPELDLMFASGVNHMFYHGSPYSPKDVPWPGWLFYASVNMNTNNTIFWDVEGLNDYITRTQSFLQYGEPDNDFLLYLPIYDIWQEHEGLHLMFDIHRMRNILPAFFDIVNNIQSLGFDTDYISDKYLQVTEVSGYNLQTPGAKYKALIVPSVRYIPVETLSKLVELARDGATVIFADRLPSDVPGLQDLASRQMSLKNILSELPAADSFPEYGSFTFGKGQIIYGTDYSRILQVEGARQEDLVARHGVQLIRREHADGHHYFISMLQNRYLDDWVNLSVDAESAIIYDPLTGTSGKARIRKQNETIDVYLQLEPGQSLIIKTFTSKKVKHPDYNFYLKGSPKVLLGDWSFRFTEGMPAIEGEYAMKGNPFSWTELPHDSATVYAGTGRYTVNFEISESADNWLLDLGFLCESARVYINGQDAGLVWSLPYTLKIGQYIKQGSNSLEIDVTNLPANRIRDFDRRGVNWRIFKDINFISVHYNNIRFDDWDISPSGLTSPVSIIPLSKISY